MICFMILSNFVVAASIDARAFPDTPKDQKRWLGGSGMLLEWFWTFGKNVKNPHFFTKRKQKRRSDQQLSQSSGAEIKTEHSSRCFFKVILPVFRDMLENLLDINFKGRFSHLGLLRPTLPEVGCQALFSASKTKGDVVEHVTSMWHFLTMFHDFFKFLRSS